MSESMISKVGFWQGLVVAGISILVTIITVGFIYGSSTSRLDAVEKLADKNEKKIDSVNNEINGRLLHIEEQMVSKDDIRELKTDVKDLVKKSK